VVPVTPPGRVLAGIGAIVGIAMFALPTAIIGAGFVHEVQKRSFTATATMIARVPLFGHLRPTQLAELTALLRRHDVPPRCTIVRQGEHGHAMWFIDEGRVVFRAGGRRIVLGPGSFFGELALLHGRPRTATIVTLTPCRLPELTASDFHRPMIGDEVLRRSSTRTGRPARRQGRRDRHARVLGLRRGHERG
jgi:voltage-gated potassium channel